ncbi:MAG: asparaginase domain-containing protein [Pseudomonadota bacterium]
MLPVRIIVTGGTIDKVHDPLTETLTFSKDDNGNPAARSHIPALLEQGRTGYPIIQYLLMKDSLEFTDADRALLTEAVNAAGETALVITHGTGTMGESARWLAQHGTADKTVVLTGAMRPHSIGASDAPFNLGGALIAAQTLPPGVYGVMNGRVFPAEALDKDTTSGRFD